MINNQLKFLIKLMEWHISNVPIITNYISELNRLTNYNYSESYLRGIVDGIFEK